MFRVALFLFVFVAFSSEVFADKKCLDEAADFAEKICGEIQTSGYTQLIEANGELKVGISGIVRKVLGDAGANVNGKILQNTYEGVLREDLAKAQFNVIDCKMKMANAAISQVCMQQSDLNHHEERKKISMVGSWAGSPDCTVVFYNDNGEDIEGRCDNNGYSHRIKGTYTDPSNIVVTVTRVDPNNCATNTRGYIKINDNNSATYGQNGWDGCGIKTGSGTQSWSRL